MQTGFAPPRLKSGVKYLLVANVALFLIQQTVDQFMAKGAPIETFLGLTTYKFFFQFHLWQVLTFQFLHADIMHLLLNMLMLAFIGWELESTWGTKRFLKFYFFCGVMAGLAFLALDLVSPKGSLLVGASGGIFGLFAAYGLLFGERQIYFMMLFPMKAKHMMLLLAGISFFSLLFGTGGPVSAVAHLGGMAGGFIYLIGWASWIRRKKNPKPKKKKRDSQHLKLVINNDEESDDDMGGPKTWH